MEEEEDKRIARREYQRKYKQEKRSIHEWKDKERRKNAANYKRKKKEQAKQQARLEKLEILTVNQSKQIRKFKL